MCSPQAQEWRDAMDAEIRSLLENNTWQLEDLPAGARAISTKWVFTVKRDEHGNIVRFKARLVARGFEQVQGVDFDEVYAPVSKQTTLRALLALVAHRDMHLHQLDVTTAFLNGELTETVYITQPEGYSNGDSRQVCHLTKALYGLRQAPRAWHTCLKRELESIGLRESEADPGLYVQQTQHGSLYCLVYVDDFLQMCRGYSAREGSAVGRFRRKGPRRG
jgi:hypothetical protein